MPHPEVMPVPRLAAYADELGVTTVLEGGKVTFRGDLEGVQEVMKEVCGRHAELVQFFSDKWTGPVPCKADGRPMTDEEVAAKRRHDALAALLVRSREVGRPVYVLDGPLAKPFDPNKKHPVPESCRHACVLGDAEWPVPESCRHACVLGDAEWTELPGWKDPPPDPHYFRKLYRSKWARSRDGA